MASPVDAARATTQDSTGSTSQVINLPSGIVAGDLLVILFNQGNRTTTGNAGWTFLKQDILATASDRLSVLYRWADGSESSTVTLTCNIAAKCAAVAWRITGSDSTKNPVINTEVTGASAAPNPGSLSPAGGSDDYLFLWLGGGEGVITAPPASPPTNYSNNAGNITTGNPANGNRWAIGASRQLTAATENPPSWTISASQNWLAWTLAAYGLPSGSAAGRPYLMTLDPHSHLGPPILMIPPPGGFFVNAQTFAQALTATATSTATITKSVGKILSATATSTASIVRSVGKVLSATATSTASIVKSVGKNLSATVTSTATMVKSVGTTLSATVTSTASIVFELLVAAYPPLAPLLITLRRGLAGGPPLLRPMEPGPTVITTTTFQQALTATATSTAAIVKSVGKTLSATSTTTASIVKQAGKTLSATVTTTATVVKSVGTTLSATVTSTASIVADFVAAVLDASTQIRPLLMSLRRTKIGPPMMPNPTPPPPTWSTTQALTATATTTATMLKTVGKSLTATTTSLATIVKQVGKTLAATATSIGSIATQKTKLVVLTATVTTAATIRFSISKSLTATVATTTSITKSVGKTLTATATATASMLRDIFIAGAVRLMSAFGSSPRGATSSRPADAGFDDSSPGGDASSSPDTGTFDAPDPGGETDSFPRQVDSESG